MNYNYLYIYIFFFQRLQLHFWAIALPELDDGFMSACNFQPAEKPKGLVEFFSAWDRLASSWIDIASAETPSQGRKGSYFDVVPGELSFLGHCALGNWISCPLRRGSAKDRVVGAAAGVVIIITLLLLLVVVVVVVVAVTVVVAVVVAVVVVVVMSVIVVVVVVAAARIYSIYHSRDPLQCQRSSCLTRGWRCERGMGKLDCDGACMPFFSDTVHQMSFVCTGSFCTIQVLCQ